MILAAVSTLSLSVAFTPAAHVRAPRLAVRTPRGRDILAACGQLKSASQRQKGQRTGLGKTRETAAADAT